MSIKEYLTSAIMNNKGKTAGVIIGLIFGILLLTIGWKAFLLAFCAAVGLWIGSFNDRRESFLEFLEKILPNLSDK